MKEERGSGQVRTGTVYISERDFRYSEGNGTAPNPVTELSRELPVFSIMPHDV